MAPTMVARLIEAAETLLANGTRSSAFRRRAVSTAYYAVFHALAKACANSLLPNETLASTDYERVYRALDHGPLRDAFNKEPLRQRDTLRRIGDLVVHLQSERKRADYLPPLKNVFSPEQVRDLIGQAQEAISKIEALSAEDRQALAISLLFKSRGQQS